MLHKIRNMAPLSTLRLLTERQLGLSQVGLVELESVVTVFSVVCLTECISLCVDPGFHRPTTQIAHWMATAIQALTQQSDKFIFIITPKKRPDVLRVRTVRNLQRQVAGNTR